MCRYQILTFSACHHPSIGHIFFTEPCSNAPFLAGCELCEFGEFEDICPLPDDDLPDCPKCGTPWRESRSEASSYYEYMDFEWKEGEDSSDAEFELALADYMATGERSDAQREGNSETHWMVSGTSAGGSRIREQLQVEQARDPREHWIMLGTERPRRNSREYSIPLGTDLDYEEHWTPLRSELRRRWEEENLDMDEQIGFDGHDANEGEWEEREEFEPVGEEDMADLARPVPALRNFVREEARFLLPLRDVFHVENMAKFALYLFVRVMASMRR